MDQNGDLGTAASMIVAALLSAVVTATVVIAVGQFMIEHKVPSHPSADAILIRTSG